MDDRESRREARQAEREARRAEREARRAERRSERESWDGFLGQSLGHRIRAEIRQSIGGSIGDRIREEIHQGLESFGGVEGAPGPGEVRGSATADEVIEHTFTVSGMPRVTVRNVSGENEITVGEAGQVFVRARKRMTGWSEERAKRLLANVEVRLEQKGDDILIEPRLFEQERGWLELFRGGRVTVDLEIRVPRETQLDATTVSGELSVNGTRGPLELRSVSGDLSVTDVQGPMRVRSVSGDIDVTEYAGQVEANSVSGDVRFERSRVRSPEVVTVSGDVDVNAVVMPADAGEGRVKTVSGDVELSFAEADVEVDYSTTSGDAVVEGPAEVHKEGRRDRRIVVGRGTGRLRVKTISGDLSCRFTDPAEAATTASSPAADQPIPLRDPAAPPPPPAPPASSAAAREVLDRLARGELSVDDAAAALDAARAATQRGPWAG